METLHAIHSRRSIRKYTAEPICEIDVKKILDAAMVAPSAGNAQPWHFIVIDERAILDAIPSFHPYAGMIKGAPLAILVCGDPSVEKYPGFWVQDCSAAVQNMLLTARDIGLGAVWTGIYPIEERINAFRELLNTPEHIIPMSLVVLGHPALESTHQSRYQPGKVHKNGW